MKSVSLSIILWNVFWRHDNASPALDHLESKAHGPDCNFLSIAYCRPLFHYLHVSWQTYSAILNWPKGESCGVIWTSLHEAATSHILRTREYLPPRDWLWKWYHSIETSYDVCKLLAKLGDDWKTLHLCWNVSLIFLDTSVFARSQLTGSAILSYAAENGINLHQLSNNPIIPTGICFS